MKFIDLLGVMDSCAFLNVVAPFFDIMVETHELVDYYLTNGLDLHDLKIFKVSVLDGKLYVFLCR